MKRDWKITASPDAQDREDAFDLNALLHPAQAFAHPSDVVRDPDLTLNEKRAILASWASDACAVEFAPALRCPPNGSRPVGYDDVMDALRALDKQDGEARGNDPTKRALRRRMIFGRGRTQDDHGSRLH